MEEMSSGHKGELDVSSSKSNISGSREISRFAFPNSGDVSFRSNLLLEESESSEQGEFEGIQFAFTKILNPTSILLFIQNQSEIQKFRASELTIEGEPLFLSADFKDIDLIYRIYRRYEQVIYPALEKMWQTAPPPTESHENRQSLVTDFRRGDTMASPRKNSDSRRFPYMANISGLNEDTLERDSTLSPNHLRLDLGKKSDTGESIDAPANASVNNPSIHKSRTRGQNSGSGSDEGSND
mmetsp:Transcript_10735/g.16329  ORF Transcript_10735/g.16329 Transcript_10735/m.16329 type:complete len:240 (-) Transcript_10735:7124-7843(-)